MEEWQLCVGELRAEEAMREKERNLSLLLLEGEERQIGWDWKRENGKVKAYKEGIENGGPKQVSAILPRGANYASASLSSRKNHIPKPSFAVRLFTSPTSPSPPPSIIMTAGAGYRLLASHTELWTQIHFV